MAKHRYKDAFDILNERGLLEYGSHIPGDLIRDLLGIETPQTIAEYKKASLEELAGTDYIRNILLGQGKYLTRQGDDYRIGLASENTYFIEQYMKSADSKLARALKLSRNSPKEAGQQPDQQKARILMKREGLRHRAS